VIDFSSEVSSTISNRVPQPRSTSFSAVDGVTHAILPLMLQQQKFLGTNRFQMDMMDL